MDKRTFVGLCAALAFVAGSPAVHALKIVDKPPTIPRPHETARGSNTYAKEMLTTTATTNAKDEERHDDVLRHRRGTTSSSPRRLTSGPIRGMTYLVTYTLDGMVFQNAPTIAAPGRSDPEFNGCVRGGRAGDKNVVFRMDSDAAAVDSGSTLIVLDAQFRNLGGWLRQRHESRDEPDARGHPRNRPGP